MTTMDLDKINNLIALKNFEQAKEGLKELLAADEKNLEALKLLGLCNVSLGAFSEGKNNFETIVKHKQDDALSWFYLANCYDNLEDFIHAKPAYLEVIKLRENYIDAYKNLAVVYLKTNEAQKAFDLAKKALEITQDDYNIYFMAGTACMAMKDFANSQPYIEKAIELNPNHAQLYNNMGTICLVKKEYEKAKEYYIKATELDSKDSLTFYNIGSIYQLQQKHKEACEYFQKAYDLEPQEHYLVALALSEYKSKQFHMAIKHYKTLVSQHPEKHNFQYNLASCYEMIGEDVFAIKILEQLVLLNPKSVVMAQKLANIYLKVNQPQHAKEIYQGILSQGNVSDEIYYEYALICYKTNDIDTAEKILKKVIELNPQSARARKDLGVIYLSKRLFDYAKDEFQQAYSIDPENAEIIFEYANFLYATSDFTKAKELYQKALEKMAENSILKAEMLKFSALNELAINNTEAALAQIEQALKINPEDDFILFTAGKINYLNKNFDHAQLLLIKAYESNPNSEVCNLLALNYFEQKEFEKANTIFLKLLEENEKNTTLLFNSAKCYKNLNFIELAETQLQKALEIFPEFDEANELFEAIKKEKEHAD